PLPGQAQAIPQFSTIEPHEYDTVNLGTLGIQLNVPIRTKAGHIPFSYRLVGASQVTFARGGYFVASPSLTPGEAHVPQYAGYSNTTLCYNHGLPNGQQESGFYVTDALGVNHPFSFFLGSDAPSCNTVTSKAGYATDNSGFYLSVNWNHGSPNYTVWDISGNISTADSSGDISSMTD